MSDRAKRNLNRKRQQLRLVASRQRVEEAIKDFVHSEKHNECLRCGRELTDEKSRQLGTRQTCLVNGILDGSLKIEYDIDGNPYAVRTFVGARKYLKEVNA